MLTSEMLSTFILVAEHAGFTAAATEANIAKGVVSKRIGQLEARLGHPLFRRTTRSVHLTPAGEIFLDTARKIMLELEAGTEALSSLRSEPSGPVRMTAPVSWGTEVLAKLIPRFLQAYPKIEVELILSDSLMDLAHERIDIALRMTIAPLPDQVAIPLSGLERLLCASPKYIKTFGAPKSPADLMHHACLSYWSETGQQAWHLVRKNEKKIVPIVSRYRVNNPNAVKDAVMAGIGVGLLPDYVCARELESGKLVRVLPSWRPETQFGTKIYAVGLPERVRLSRCQTMLAFLKEALAKKI
ncbi:MAG: LysR family transcriptional regulator [Burkholderiales bacterium]|nr:LysR family transcriptional regulator [Burkholderiales bacterium]